MRSPELHPYPAAVLETARRRRLFGPADRVLVALSGGADSTALLAALAALRDAGALAEVRALYLDHGLRTGSEPEAASARGACARLGVPLEERRLAVKAGNVQAEARRVRYAALREAAARAGSTRIATGHTLGDQAETVLLRLLRGAGARGLAAIPPRRGEVIRPLIDRTREEGNAYLRALGLGWGDDPTNAAPRYARNRLRLELWPLLRAVAPAADRALARAADLAREDERALDRRARAVAGDGAAVDLAALRGEPIAVRRRVVRRLWRAATGSGRALEARHVAAVLALLRRGRPGETALPGGRRARCRYGRLELLAGPGAPAPEVAPVEVPGPGRYALPALRVWVEVGAARPDAVPWPLTLRTRRPGDRFRPDRGPGGTKLKRWLIDRKVPREARDRLVLLAAPGGAVLAVPELGAVAEGLGPSGAGLRVRISAAPGTDGSYCKGGEGLL
ncbi:tRNA lysidine(34) synthetase TilS [Anaeromyxobacter dehalogenans]|uniref:tRNA(Ile)-lysidine synthase n=1 Tax=Anaeromyxobacter dehalogenans (strain 2CP-C) TaxID=290397 RepID=Q2IHY7_ANADE|nr:tRNA lysidine(34) synthetase TilS [Anaeromyxobacter dehalogenans]ABC81267.1 tRNA(Ile)-lysidine synthetase-like protein [Anaeromyxobacter dehalogenans 2CP-C]